ncbi:dioxygenase [Tolypothrix sp. VBCCA 56010]|uniref:dioxygenase family protein n=1 Tax=Tolypothrix sp. VBCCA 56010 TaxID=3137731 RepID=UPI003D7D524C
MRNITLENITQAVIQQGDKGKTDARLYEIYTSLVRHLHAFVQEVNLTEQELSFLGDFLIRADRYTEEIPNGEIHMLFDLLGISELVVLLHNKSSTATESNVEGPVYVADAPERNMGDRLGIDPDGNTLFLSGRVLDLNNKPIANALLDVWQSNSKGLYDLQDASQAKGNFRGRFRTNSDGSYAFETVVPIGYSVPSSGPCGEMLQLLGRHTQRAGHIHFKLSAAGYIPLTTQIHIDGDPHLDSDTTFAVRSAIIKLQKHETLDKLNAYSQSKPFYTAEFDFVLQPTDQQTDAA